MALKTKDKGKRLSSSRGTSFPSEPTRFATREAEDRYHACFVNQFVVCEHPIKIDNFPILPIGPWLQDRNW